MKPVFVVLGVIIFIFVILKSCSYINSADYYTRNGYITGKTKRKVSCSHSYSCNCREVCRGSGKDRSCDTECATCYYHSYDINWIVNSTIGDFYIDREDSQGLVKPKRWAQVEKNDAVVRSAYFKNPIKANKASLFHNKKKHTVKYPDNIYDYYKVDRFINLLEKPVDTDYNKLLSDFNKKLSDKYNVNIILILSNNKDNSFYEELEASWLNGKLNDIIIAIDLTAENRVNLVHIISFADELIKVKLKIEIKDKETFSFKILEDSLEPLLDKYYKLPDLKQFNYLTN